MKQILLFCFLFIGSLYAQEYEVTGKVTDVSNNPLPGVSVLIKGTTQGVSTDFDGKYTIKVKNGDILEFSSLGMKTKQVKVNGQKVINVVLEEDNVALQEVVVTSYETAKRRDVTSSSIRIRGAGSVSGNYGTKNGYTLNTSRETYKAIDEGGFKKTAKDPVTTFSADVDRASYSNVRRMLNYGQKPHKDAVRIEELINYFDYNYTPPAEGSKTPLNATTTLSSCPWNPDNYLLRIGLQAKKIDLTKAPPSNIVFLIDTSGSMDEPNKMPLLKASFKLLLDNLRPEDRIAIVVYASQTGIALPSTPAKEKEKISKVIDDLVASGSTAGGAGLQTAYEVAEKNFLPKGNNRIILATDGDFNVGISSRDELQRLVEEKRNNGIYISVLGYGMGNYRDDMVETIANKGNGNYAYIDNLTEAKKVLVNEFGGTLYTVAKDVKLQLEFNPQYVKEYRLVGYENRTLANEDFEDDKKDAGEIGAGHTVTALYELIPTKGATTDGLRYQKQVKEGFANELAFLKIRYKDPVVKDAKSVEESTPIPFTLTDFTQTDDDYRFAAAVAEWGMLLRNSKYKAKSSYKQVIDLAKNATGKDEEGYRKEFIRLVELSEKIK
ncbi:vWA domain-containing protein [Capnocytophaga periodontitidis]|uniref:von Willebrand factor type A domain-containing protein n=1 Tax=Capnocytophaga periodontitidis TaxID=2795027 RepID=A0ABS0SPD4_9FLAO|nr:VWA domain-containing protein [Capnocytophaga periodontitidis]MBI1647545.1 von Willebrand factor type A domain-containing protein [Capnocytophaga periodontitidis]MBI1668918.1 von Willebrand factor type A domain-containing protein [Capnocytophaga periodontitidis]